MDFKKQIFNRYKEYEVIGNSSYELHLRTYEKLTQEELLIINKIIFYDKDYISDYTKQLISVICTTSGNIDDDWSIKAEFNDVCLVIQYLIEIGIIIPLLFIDENKNPVTIYPDDLMDLDYIKII